MKKLIALLALVSSQVFAAPQLAKVTEVQMIQESGNSFLSFKLDRLPFDNECVAYNTQDRVFLNLNGRSETEVSILAGQSISTIAVGIPISLDTTGQCDATYGLEAKDLTFVRNIKYDFYQPNRVLENISKDFVWDAPQKNNSSSSQRIYVTGGNQGTYNCDLRAYVGDEASTLKMVSASTIGSTGLGKHTCSVSFDVPPNSWWRMHSTPITDRFDWEFPNPTWVWGRGPTYSAYEEYRQKMWWGKKNYDQSLWWEGQTIFRSQKHSYVPWRSGEYVYHSAGAMGKQGNTYHYKVKRKRDDKVPSGKTEYQIIRERSTSTL